jgi:hypothetical protein
VDQTCPADHSQRTAVFIACIGFVPPTYFFLADFPAQVHDSSVAHMGEVAEAQIDVFHQDAEFLDGLKIGADTLEACDVVGSHRCASSQTGLSGRFPNFIPRADQHGFAPLHLRQVGLELRDQLVGLEEGKHPFGAAFIIIVCHRR